MCKYHCNETLKYLALGGCALLLLCLLYLVLGPDYSKLKSIHYTDVTLGCYERYSGQSKEPTAQVLARKGEDGRGKIPDAIG